MTEQDGPIRLPDLPEGIEMACIIDIGRRQLAVRPQREWVRREPHTGITQP